MAAMLKGGGVPESFLSHLLVLREREVLNLSKKLHTQVALDSDGGSGVSEGSLGSPEPPQNLSVSPPRSTSPEPQDLSLPSTSRSYQHQYHHRDYHYPSHNFHPPSTSQCDNTNRGEHLASHADFPVENLERRTDFEEEYSARDENIGREPPVRLAHFRGEKSVFGRENLTRLTDSGGEIPSFGRESSGRLSDFDRETTARHTPFEGENYNFGEETSAHLQEPSVEEARKDDESADQQRTREQVEQDQYQVWARRYILAKQGQIWQSGEQEERDQGEREDQLERRESADSEKEKEEEKEGGRMKTTPDMYHPHNSQSQHQAAALALLGTLAAPVPITPNPIFPYTTPEIGLGGNPNGLLVRALASTTPRRTRGEKKPIPDTLKDEKYYERRKRNNLAAKKSRDARKQREDQIALRATVLEKENAVLRAQVATLREEATSLRDLLMAKRTKRQ